MVFLLLAYYSFHGITMPCCCFSIDGKLMFSRVCNCLEISCSCKKPVSFILSCRQWWPRDLYPRLFTLPEHRLMLQSLILLVDSLTIDHIWVKSEILISCLIKWLVIEITCIELIRFWNWQSDYVDWVRPQILTEYCVNQQIRYLNEVLLSVLMMFYIVLDLTDFTFFCVHGCYNLYIDFV